MSKFDTAVFDPALAIGTVTSVTARRVRMNLKAGTSGGSGAIVNGIRYGLGEVGEFVIIQGEGMALLGRVLETLLPDRDRLSVEPHLGRQQEAHPIGEIQLLASISLTDNRVQSGVSTYPRLGAKVFSAPHRLVATLPERMGRSDVENKVTLQLGTVKNARDAIISITPERVFGRHCAVLGATGGGKSYTVAKLIEECVAVRGKAILIDATGEYWKLDGAVRHAHLGSKPDEPKASEEIVVPYTDFHESDFVALFQPSAKAQAPKLREAIRSLRFSALNPKHKCVKNGVFIKVGADKAATEAEMRDTNVATKLGDPATPFDVTKLADQLVAECINEYSWKSSDDFSLGYCSQLIGRIQGIIHSDDFDCVFKIEKKTALSAVVSDFIKNPEQSVLRISMENVRFGFNAREIIANAIGRYFLKAARNFEYRQSPLLLFVDEAHQFLNKTAGSDDFSSRLDAFELIAKEGRKYGLCICLATQRPRDIPEGVLSQMGTLIVHRLTNDRDREVVERACGEIDRSASAFLPNLEPGEAAIIGVDFPIPLTIQVREPRKTPSSQGPDFQAHWGEKAVQNRK